MQDISNELLKAATELALRRLQTVNDASGPTYEELAIAVDDAVTLLQIVINGMEARG